MCVCDLCVYSCVCVCVYLNLKCTRLFLIYLIHSFFYSPVQDFFQFAGSPGINATLRKRAEKFKAHLTKKFRWDFDVDLDECAPVVVELPEGVTLD